MATSGATDGASEEAVLDRMLTRLALTEETQLEKVLSKLLPLAVSRLGSSYHPTKMKVMEMLSHINKRVKDQASIQLPLRELLKLYISPDSASMVRNFALVYIEMAYDRAPVDEQTEVVGSLLLGLAKAPVQHQDMILRMAAKGLDRYAGYFSNNQWTGEFLKDPASCEIFLTYCLHILLFQPMMTTPEGALVPPPGLSVEQAKRVNGKSVLKGDSLTSRKLGVLNYLAEIELPTDSVYPLYIVAAADGNERVSRRGEELLKRKANGANLEDPSLIKRLFAIFQGSSISGETPEQKVAPAGPNLKARLMSVFTRSIVAANAFPSTLQCVFDCIYGPGTTMKLKHAGMEFAVWIFKHASDDQLKPMAQIILSGLLKLLDGQDPGDTDSSSKQLRSFTYQAIGQLSLRAPHLFNKNTDMAVRMFAALRSEPDSVRVTVQEALSSLANAYKARPDVFKEIESLLLENIKLSESGARFCSVLWATRLYPFSHAPSRFICMLGAGDVKLDIREMANEGLRAPNAEKEGVEGSVLTAEYPGLRPMMEYICQQQPHVLSKPPLGERTMLFPPKAYAAMITFVQHCYENEIGLDKSKLKGKEDVFSDILGKTPPEEAFQLLMEHGMAIDGTADLQGIASTGLLKLASFNPNQFADAYATRITWLRQFIGHIDSTTREAIARLLGIAVSSLSAPQAADLLQQLLSTFHNVQKARFEDLHGSICAAGYVLAQCMTNTPAVPESLICDALNALFKETKNANPSLAGSAAEAIGHAGLRKPLPVVIGDLASAASSTKSAKSSPEEAATTGVGAESSTATTAMPSTATTQEKEKSDDGRAVVEKGELSLASIVTQLRVLLGNKDVKVMQKAAIALGHLCFGDRSVELANASLTALFTLSKTKAEDVLFSVGEALAFIWGGVPVTANSILKSNYVSMAATSNYLSGESLAYGKDVEMIDAVESTDDTTSDPHEINVKKLFDELLFSGYKDERCSGSVWLLSIISYCGHHPRVQSMLPQIQEAFSHLLGEQNELTQEMASRGMSIVYDLGDAATKDELVKALVSNLTGAAKKKRVVKVMEDTVVFEENTLGETPGGGNISTYKELCNIANEMGQPDLIYKFMDLANHQASLNSKRGAAFGFARIAKQAGDALKPHLKTLVPKLVRYQYDPNKAIQDAMGHIWRSLVAEPKKTIDEFYDEIMEDLLSQAGSRLWRSRESSCSALADLIQGRRFSEVGKYLEKVWNVAFRAVDDIKETVRTSGDVLCRSVSSLSLRLSDNSLSPEKDARDTMAIVLPFLLTKGIMSTVSDVRRLSINTVMKLVKGAGAAIRPQMPDLVSCMIESLSSLEDQRLNYAELHAERVGISQEKLESVRIAVAKDSPMWDTLDLCIRHVDNSTLESLIPRLVQLIQSGVGLNTRVGVGKFISMLAQHSGPDMKPHSVVLLRALFSAVKSEKSAASRKAFAAALGSVAKYTSETQVRKLLLDAVALYNSENDRDQRMVSALVLKELSRQADDVFKGNYTLILPMTFVARFDDEKDIVALFEEIWEDNTSSASVTLTMYMPEIVKLLIEGIGSSSWTQKQKSARALSKLAENVREGVTPFAQELFGVLLAEIPGRLWEGKEVVLEALGALCKACYSAKHAKVVSAPTPTIGPDAIVSAVVAACGRKKKAFRDAAFACLEQVLLALDYDTFEQVRVILLDACLQAPPRKDKVELKEGEEPKEEGPSVPYEKVLGCLTATITSASTATVSSHEKEISSALAATLGIGHTWQVKNVSLSTIKGFVGKVKEGKKQAPSLESLVLPIFECVSTVKIAQVRNTALETLAELVQVANLTVGLPEPLVESLVGKLTDLQSVERVPTTLHAISQCLDSLRSNAVSPMQE
ncbi:LOW QUALITY PROTEIN: uncharacterized protein [Physcomitrium patens]|uniref:LOW QUALITY PROTEIN: uncharacterized protein n=1 Tax=Physcomitrium patens TaxID=3218 RepID=UPI000D1707BE|nr:LOW QUALITY PROTEIN: proteasome-associated protein ECM29 homolog [Physcomitrium patens]|eukprot:XP_024395125.1 LOW QUALITY PROTEIN: proteasome-associated protein ECM29 homolog [Physcomitrella patens]